jgi:hypothetical protein
MFRPIGPRESIEALVKVDIYYDIPDFRPDVRFIPYLHSPVTRVRGAVFSVIRRFSLRSGNRISCRALRRDPTTFPTPEDINDHANTAPSRSTSSLSRLRKVIDGTLAARSFWHGQVAPGMSSLSAPLKSNWRILSQSNLFVHATLILGTRWLWLCLRLTRRKFVRPYGSSPFEPLPNSP